MWAERVKNMMQAKNLTQKELAKITGIAESSLSRYLSSEKTPRLDIVNNVARAFEVDAGYFIDDERFKSKESAYSAIAAAIARDGSELNEEEKLKLIQLLVKAGE